MSSEFNNKKFIYDEIIRMEELYNNAEMKDIKENLFQIKLKRREKYKETCRRNNVKIGSFRLFEGINISESAENSYLNPAHPSLVAFICLIKICQYLEIELKEIIKPTNPRIKRKSYFPERWTEQLIHEFLQDYKIMNIEEISIKYKISSHSVLNYYTNFSANKNVNRQERSNSKD